jgi:radical SAM superfamily enzyme YgiQ (UPF0313 family)
MEGKKEKGNFSVLLLVPRYRATEKVNYEYTFPIGLGYILRVIKDAGYDVTCINMNHRNGTIAEIMKGELDKKRYDVVGTGHIGMGYTVVKRIVEAVRAHPSKPRIILGGALMTSEPDLMLDALKPDYAVLGEGETTVLELLECMRNGLDAKNVKGITFRDNDGNRVETGPREPIADINQLPFSDYEGLEYKEYLGRQPTNSYSYNNQYDEPRAYPILCSRSCPFQCTFCYHSIGGRYRERSIENAFQEIKEAVAKYDINVICIYDDLFSYRKERIYEFCERIKELNKGRAKQIRWNCQLSVNTVDPEMLNAMREAGCDFISYGFESFSQEVLKSMKKPISPQQIDYAFKATLGAHVGIQANFIFGDTAETKETAKQTLDYWKSNCEGQVSLLFIQPYPGSAIYRRCLEKGIIKDKLEFIETKMDRDVVFNFTEKMTDEEVGELAAELQHAMMKYVKTVIPLRLEKEGRRRYGRYKASVKCPFCSEVVEYGNYSLQSRWMYITKLLICRKCKMRFNVASPLMKLSQETNLFPMIQTGYRKMVKLLDRNVR